jgi:hypothetical protein
MRDLSCSSASSGRPSNRGSSYACRGSCMPPRSATRAHDRAIHGTRREGRHVARGRRTDAGCPPCIRASRTARACGESRGSRRVSTSWSRRVLVELQVVVSGAVGPLVADAIMFSDPCGEHAPSPRTGATRRACGRLARPPNSRAKLFLGSILPFENSKMTAETHCPKVRDEIARCLRFLAVCSDSP